MTDAEKTTLDGWLWRPRYWVARKLIYAGMRIMPECRYRRELNASLWTLGLRVQAHCAGLRAAGARLAQTRAQATPGPWRVDYLDQNGQRVVKGEHIEIATCWHHSVGAIEKEMEANARLIAAAPDLLNALELAEGHLEEMRRDARWHPVSHCPVLDRVRQVIAQAGGKI